MAWIFESDRPIYMQVMEHLKLQIVSGELAPGSRLTAVRDMAAEASINPNTMQKALSELEREGLLHTQRTNGRFVTDNQQLISQLRYTLGREKLLAFISQMDQLGYRPTQLAEMLGKVMEESSNG